MKKVLFYMLMLLAFKAVAQNNAITSITISLPANPDANTANWVTGSSLLTISANAKMENGSVAIAAEESKILVFIRKNGIRVCGAYNTGTAPLAGFISPVKAWSGNQSVSLIGQNCTLAPGSYELVVQFFGSKNGSSIATSEEKAKAFTILNTQQLLQSPQNLSPVNESEFTLAVLTAPIVFKWTPLTPAQGTPVKYRLKIWQLMAGQSNSQAMQANTPLVTKDVNAATQTVLTNLINGPCIAPLLCQFVWTVQALNADGNPIGPNNGKSTPTTFRLASSQTTASNTSGCNTTATKTFVSGDEIGLSDGFIMQLSENPTGTNNSLSGKGTVYVKWLGLLKVQFKEVKINGDNKLCDGAVYTQTDPGQDYPTQWAINAMNNLNAGAWTINKVHAVGSWIQGNKLTKPLVKATNQLNETLTPVPLSMPIGYFKDADENTAIGFTEMIFKPDHAEFEAIASLNTEKMFKDSNPFNPTDAIALEGSGIYFTPSGLSGVAGAIKLVEPFAFIYSNNGTENLKLTFNKEANGHIGNGVVFSAEPNQFWTYNLDVNVQLPKEWLVPVEVNKTNVDINFQAEITEWNDFVLEGNLPACIIPNSNGLGIQAGMITYDHSNLSNAANMVFPSGYTGNTNAMFTGFYLKNFKLTLPDQLRTYTDTTKRIEVIAENLIIDKSGVTGKILANNVLTYPKANIGNLGASIDQVKVELHNSSLTSAKMEGKITLPLSSTDQIDNAINYSALFTPSGTGNNQTSSLVFSLSPNHDITSKFLGEGKIQIDQTSSLSLILSKSNSNKRAIYFDIDLNGKVYYPTGKIIDLGSSMPLDLDLSCNFEHLGMHYQKDTDETFTFQVGHWSFASPQKKFSGFPFTITDVKAKIEPISAGTEKQYLFKGGVEFVAKINIGSENSPVHISGDTKIALTGAIESAQYTAPQTTATGNAQLVNVATAQSATMSVLGTTNVGVMTNAVKTDYGFLTQLKPKYLGVKVESIHIDATMPAVSIKGSVVFYKEDPVYGNGFKGDLEAKFTTLNMGIQAGAIFGNTKYIPNNSGNGFKYWKVEAQITLPPPGIVFLTGLAFRGFGAGVYSRMDMQPPDKFDPVAASASTFGGATFTPDATVKMGFKVKAIIATAPKEETFNGSIGLAAQFNTSGGINNIEIDGQFNCGAKIGEENQAFASGELYIDYDFPLKKFSTNLDINFNKDPITTPSGPVNAHFYIDGLKNEWAFTSGTPTHLNTIRLFNTINVSSYLMFGNKIETPTGFMAPTIAGFAGVNQQLPTFTQTASGNTSKTGKGFAFGIGVFTKRQQDKPVASGTVAGISYSAGITANFDIGSEINASLLQYENCPGFGDGWRVRAGIAIYALLTGKAYYTLAGASGEVNLLSLGFGAFAMAEFPNPFYAEGAFTGRISLTKKISFSYTAEFKTGEKCEGTPTETADVVYEQQNAEDGLNYTLINNIVSPAGATDISKTTTFAVMLNYPDNEEFAIEEQQASGELKVRTFRAAYTATLVRDSLSNKPKVINKGLNKQIAFGTENEQSNENTSSKSLVKQKAAAINKANLTSTDPNQVAIVSAGYDALGARCYKLSKNSNFQVNPLQSNTSYLFTIKGRLEEKINGGWQAVKHPLSHQFIVQTKHIYFKTNSDTITSSPVKASKPGLKKSIKL